MAGVKGETQRMPCSHQPLLNYSGIGHDVYSADGMQARSQRTCDFL